MKEEQMKWERKGDVNDVELFYTIEV